MAGNGWTPEQQIKREKRVQAGLFILRDMVNGKLLGPARILIDQMIGESIGIVKARGDQPDSDPPIPNSATPQGA